MYVRKNLVLIAAVMMNLFSACQLSTKTEEKVRIIPQPVKVAYKGVAHTFKSGVKVAVEDTSLNFLRTYLLDQLQDLSTSRFFYEDESGTAIQLKLDDKIDQAEGYHLTINKQIVLSAKTKQGIIQGIQSLLQILEQGIVTSKGLEIPQLEVTDYPRFAYRGMHLDVSRHFFGVDFVKKYIDLIAMHKMNTFHWHLTDDQGWRIEIKKYPKLTDVGAWRVDHEDLPWNERPSQEKGEKATYGGFYTQEQIKYIVAYAADRGITVIPEIDIPGHSAAAIAAYPELSCRNVDIGVSSGGRSEVNIVCGGNDEVLEFYKNVLTEVIELFPSKYIHIGGDEAWKSEWEKCPLCQKKIKEQNLENEHELQSYFIQNIDHFLTSKGRAMIGWDEILEGGLAQNATVMSWRGETGGIKAAQMKHDVIMTPVGTCYFDYYQSTDKDLEPLAFNGYISMSKVYNYEPVPGELSDDEAKYVLGAQGNVWTEYMPTSNLVEYRSIPRMTALSEVLWSPEDARDEAGFVDRLQFFIKWLTDKDYNFHIPTPQGIFDEMIFIDSTRVELTNEWPFAEIHYTLDDSEPTVNSAIYSEPLTISESTVLKSSVFLVDGRHGLIKTARFEKATPKQAFDIDSRRLESGLKYKYYESAIHSVKEIKKLNAKSSGILKQIGLPEEHRTAVFAAQFDGYFYAPQTQVYTFALQSDDGSQLYIGNELVVDHDGPHGPSVKYGQVALKQGYYPISVSYFDGGGGNMLKIHLKTGDEKLSELSPNLLFHSK